MTAIRDPAIWEALKGEKMDLAEDQKTTFYLSKNKFESPGRQRYRVLIRRRCIGKIKIAPGYKIELFASEKEFPDLPIRYNCHSITKAGFGWRNAQLPTLQTRRQQTK